MGSPAAERRHTTHCRPPLKGAVYCDHLAPGPAGDLRHGAAREGVGERWRDPNHAGRPHWVDLVAQRCKEVLQLQVEAGVTRRQAALLDDATTKITQHVNLFDKVLIPLTQANIRRIDIVLGDIERSAVVNSKIAKRNRRDTTI
jgi:ATP synthase subunit D